MWPSISRAYFHQMTMNIYLSVSFNMYYLSIYLFHYMSSIYPSLSINVIYLFLYVIYLSLSINVIHISISFSICYLSISFSIYYLFIYSFQTFFCLFLGETQQAAAERSPISILFEDHRQRHPSHDRCLRFQPCLRPSLLHLPAHAP